MKQASGGENPLVFFVTDLHGRISRYTLLEEQIMREKPGLLLFGGDLLPHFQGPDDPETFVGGFLTSLFLRLKKRLKKDYPRVMMILGNDDPACVVSYMLKGEETGLWTYLHGRKLNVAGYSFYGYSFIPPTPFLFKDWEKYDVSRYTDPGCIPPDCGKRSVVPDYDPSWANIAEDLNTWPGDPDLSRSVFLFHSPPYRTGLDRAALDGQTVDYVPLDVHIGSIAVYRFIMNRQPFLTLHGHVHESTRLTGTWMEKLGRTVAIQGAGDTEKLVLIRFYLEYPEQAVRLEL